MSLALPAAGQKEAAIRIVGHEWAVDLLARQLRQEQAAHAYLLTGPAQVGKGTLARWLAQALLCEGQGQVPCGSCKSCQLVAAGKHPDLHLINLEVQAGGRRKLGIEAIRDMRMGLAERPFLGRRKFYLVEDAGSMTDEAQNALLKTLEEPPPFVVIVLVALADQMLLPTIVSRCQSLVLRPLSRQQVRQALVERWGAAPEQADLLASLSQGRLGWAVQALQDGRLLEKRREDLDELSRLLEAGLLERFSFAEKQEKAWKKENYAAVLGLLEHWQGWWRDLLLVGHDCDELVVNLDCLDRLRSTARRVGPEKAAHLLQALRAARQRLDEQVNPRLVFEELLLQLPAVVA